MKKRRFCTIFVPLWVHFPKSAENCVIVKSNRRRCRKLPDFGGHQLIAKLLCTIFAHIAVHFPTSREKCAKVLFVGAGKINSILWKRR